MSVKVVNVFRALLFRSVEVVLTHCAEQITSQLSSSILVRNFVYLVSMVEEK